MNVEDRFRDAAGWLGALSKLERFAPMQQERVKRYTQAIFTMIQNKQLKLDKFQEDALRELIIKMKMKVEILTAPDRDPDTISTLDKLLGILKSNEKTEKLP